jgi:DNA-binding IclR family transcriptional regulator
LEQARKDGYAAVRDAYEVGISAIAAPVHFTGTTKAIGAVSIAGPTARLDNGKLEELAPMILKAAADLSRVSAGIQAMGRR